MCIYIYIMKGFLQHEDLKENNKKRHLKSIVQLEEGNINPLNKEDTILTKLKQYTPIRQQTLIKTI